MIALDAAIDFWLNDRSPENRNRVVAQYGYLRARAARKFYRPGLDRCDLEQVAAIGLIKACDRYEPQLQTPFEAFAWLYIVGELMHYVRDYERMIRPPRRLRELERKAHTACDVLTAQMGREPSTAELAGAMSVSVGEVVELRRYRELAFPHSLDSLESVEHRFAHYTMDVRDDRMVLESALAQLTDVERTIVLGIYAAGFSQIEIADRLGYSRRHISRLHRSALKKMQPFCVSIALSKGTDPCNASMTAGDST